MRQASRQAVRQSGRVRKKKLTIDFLFVNGVVMCVVAVRVGRRNRVVQGVDEICVAGDQVVKEAGGAMVLPFGRCMAAARGQVRGVQDGGVGVVLVKLHGAALGGGGRGVAVVVVVMVAADVGARVVMAMAMVAVAVVVAAAPPLRRPLQSSFGILEHVGSSMALLAARPLACLAIALLHTYMDMYVTICVNVYGCTYVAT